MSSVKANQKFIRALADVLSSCEEISRVDLASMRGGQGAYIASFLRNLPRLPEEVRKAVDAAVPSRKPQEQMHAVYAAVCLIVDHNDVRRR